MHASLVLLDFLLNVFLAIRHLVAVLNITNLWWNVVEPGEEEEENGTHFAGERKKEHVLRHVFVVVEKTRTSTARSTALLLPQYAALVDQTAEENRSRNRSQNSHHNPLDSERERPDLVVDASVLKVDENFIENLIKKKVFQSKQVVNEPESR